MLRGLLPDGTAWRELLSLQSSETQSAEWIDMLGSSPMPPRLVRQSSFNALRGSHPRRDFGTSSTDSELPIGEQAKPTAPQWDGSDVNSISNGMSPPNTNRGALAKIQNMLSGSPREPSKANREQQDRHSAKQGASGPGRNGSPTIAPCEGTTVESGSLTTRATRSQTRKTTMTNQREGLQCGKEHRPYRQWSYQPLTSFAWH